MTITIYNWWFSIVAEHVIEVHVQIGFLAVLAVGVVYLRKLIKRITQTN